MGNYIEGIDDYGINLIELRDRAIKEGKLDYAHEFECAIKEAISGDSEWYTRICREIAFMVSNTGMDALRINLGHIKKVDSCDNGTCLDK